MVTMIDDTALHGFVARAYEAGKIVTVVCHGTCSLLKTRLSNGDLLVKGKSRTGFANSEEAFADGFVGLRIQPFGIEKEAKKIDGTNFIVDSMFKAFAIRDSKFLITGLNDAPTMRGDQTLSVLPGSSPDDDAVQSVKVGLGWRQIRPVSRAGGYCGFHSYRRRKGAFTEPPALGVVTCFSKVTPAVVNDPMRSHR